MKRLGGGVHQRSQCPISYEMQHWYLLTLWIGRVTASSSHIASCGKVLHMMVSVFVLNPYCAEKSLCNNSSWCASLSACVCVFISVEDLLSAACLLMRGDLTDCPMWLIWRRAKLCSTPTAITPVGAQRTPFRSKRKLTHTYTHMKGGSCQCHTITGRQEPFRWKITLANQLLIESFSSAGGQWNAHNVLFPWNHSQSVASSAFTVMLILIKCNYSLFFSVTYFLLHWVVMDDDDK